jgi:hypothetical protein
MQSLYYSYISCLNFLASGMLVSVTHIIAVQVKTIPSLLFKDLQLDAATLLNCLRFRILERKYIYKYSCQLGPEL